MSEKAIKHAGDPISSIPGKIYLDETRVMLNKTIQKNLEYRISNTGSIGWSYLYIVYKETKQRNRPYLVSPNIYWN